MDETIGVKGGRNDRLRQMRITKKQKEKLKREQEDEETKDLEKQVRRLQLLTFLGVVPVVALGKAVETFTEDENKKRLRALNDTKEKIIQSEAFSEQETERIIRGLEANFLVGTLPKEVRENMGLEYKEVPRIDNPTKENATDFIPFMAEDEQKEQELNERLAVIKSQKIVDEYERQLKDIRSDLRSLSFDYEVLEESEEYTQQQTKTIDRLNTIIDKIEALKAKMSKEDLAGYDDNYLYVLVERYLADFKAGKESDDIKDSMLFVLLASKLNELDERKTSLALEVTSKKEEKKIDDATLSTMREKYYNYEQFNNQLIKFQYDQDRLLADIQEKIKNSSRIEEKIELQLRTLNLQSQRLRRLNAFQMRMPGVRSARGLSALTGTYMYFMRNLLQPRHTVRKYKVIRVEDYSRDIENSISNINSVSDSLSRTSQQLGKMIRDFERDYKEYFDSIPECKELMSNLYKIQADLKEKEYELQKIKQEQQKNLEKNNLKVKTLDNRRVA